MSFLKNRIILKNLVIMIYMWITVSGSYYLVNFQLKYLPGSIYTNTVVSAVAEIFGIFCSGVIYTKKGPITSFSTLFVSSVAGGIFVLLFGEANVGWMPIFVLLMRTGASGAFNIAYVAN
jgi:hypothetical protein